MDNPISTTTGIQPIPNPPSHADILNAIHKIRIENFRILHVIELKLDALIAAHPGADFSSEDLAVRDFTEDVGDATQNLPPQTKPTNQ